MSVALRVLRPAERRKSAKTLAIISAQTLQSFPRLLWRKWPAHKQLLKSKERFFCPGSSAGLSQQQHNSDTTIVQQPERDDTSPHQHTPTTPQKQTLTHKHKPTTTIIQSMEAPFLTGEEPPPRCGELKHALPQAGGPTQSQLFRPMSSRHHISMEHRLRRKNLLLNPNTKVRSGKNIQKREKHIFQERQKNWENEKRRNENMKKKDKNGKMRK